MEQSEISIFYTPERRKASFEELAEYQKKVKSGLTSKSQDRYYWILNYQNDPEWKNKIPSYNGLKPRHYHLMREIFTGRHYLDNGGFDNTFIPLSEEDISTTIKELFQMEYIRTDSDEELLNRYRKDELGKICTDYGVKAPKTKKECVKILMETLEPEYIKSLIKDFELAYHLTQKGREKLLSCQLLDEYYWKMCSHGIDINQAFLLKNLDPSEDLRNLMVKIYQANILREWAEENYSKCSYEAARLSSVYTHCYGDFDNACRLISLSFSCSSYVNPMDHPNSYVGIGLDEIYMNSELSAEDILEKVLEESEFSGFPLKLERNKYENILRNSLTEIEKTPKMVGAFVYHDEDDE